ncbi:MAG: hypothetical protein ABJO67_06370 [Pseudoruegeria sp.]
MKFRTMTLRALSSTALIALTGTPVFAQSLPAPGQSEEGWRHAVALYAYAPLSTSGTSAIAGNSLDIDLDLKDLLDHLDFAASGRYEAWNGDFGVIVDANYAGIAADITSAGPLGTGIDVKVRQKWIGLLAAYRVSDGTYGANNQRYTFDIQGGARYNTIKQTVDITTPGPGFPSTLGGSPEWVEPVVGARGMWRLNDQWTTIASMDLGGFGAGGNDLQIGANIGFDYQPWENSAITFGYRYFSVDYNKTLSDGEFEYDVVQHGPYVGFKYFFD